MSVIARDVYDSEDVGDVTMATNFCAKEAT